MKRIILGILCCTGLTTMAQTITLRGETDKKYDGNVLFMTNRITSNRDTLRVENGKFEITLPYKEPVYYSFKSQYESKTNGGYIPSGLLVDAPGVIHVKADMNIFSKATFTGSPAQAVYDEYRQLSARLMNEKKKELYKQFDTGMVNRPMEYVKDPKYPEYRKILGKMNENASIQAARTIIKKHPNSIGAAVTLDNLARFMELEEAERLYNTLKQPVKQSSFGVKLFTSIEGRKSSQLGTLIKDFSLNDPNGKPIAFSSLKGKYVYIDFWASWCGPCIAEFPKLKTMYEKHKGNRFEIFGISIDANTDAWHEALKSHQLPWLQVLDHKGEKSIATKQFAVKVIPTTVLVDPSGKIIAKDLRGKELEAELARLFPD